MKFKTTFLIAVFFIPAVLAAQTATVPDYKIYSVERQQEISLKRLIRDLRKADVVFFGEEHNDSVTHALQLEVFRGLHRKQGGNLSLSLEMFQTDVQLVLDEYLTGLIREANLLKDTRPWSNYKDYRPLMEYARENGIHVLAANAPSRYTNRVTRHGIGSLDALSEESKGLLAPLPIDTLTGRYHEKFAGLMGGHEGMGDMHIYQSQNVWDATMAWKIAGLADKFPEGQILHLNGRFHSDERLGTYAHLHRYAPALKLMNISAFSHDSFDAPHWDDWKDLGDFIILTRP